jgi:hypothetical protein
LQRLSPIELTWQELLATLAVLLIPAAIILARPSPTPVRGAGIAGGWTPLLFLAAMLSVGLLRRPPLRSLPVLGAAMLICSYLFLFQWVADLISPALISGFAPGFWERDTYLVLKAVSTGMLWITLFCLTLLVMALLALYNRFQPLCWRIRHDWSLLSFILHGEAVFVLLLLVEHHRSERPFAIACLLWLGAGVWLYQRSRTNRARALIAGTAGLVAVSLAIHELVSMGATGGFAWQWGDVGRVLMTPAWILLGLLLPVWIAGRLPAWRDLRQKGV